MKSEEGGIRKRNKRAREEDCGDRRRMGESIKEMERRKNLIVKKIKVKEGRGRRQ